jgi:hypothetical protein
MPPLGKNQPKTGQNLSTFARPRPLASHRFCVCDIDNLAGFKVVLLSFKSGLGTRIFRYAGRAVLDVPFKPHFQVVARQVATKLACFVLRLVGTLLQLA